MFEHAIITKLTSRAANWKPGVAQLVAHLTGGQGVVSSSLATRTKGKSLWDLPFYFVNFYFLLHGNVQLLAIGRLYVEVLFYI